MRPLLGVVGAPSAGKAIGLIVAGVTLFSISDVAAKQLSERLLARRTRASSTPAATG